MPSGSAARPVVNPFWTIAMALLHVIYKAKAKPGRRSLRKDSRGKKCPKSRVLCEHLFAEIKGSSGAYKAPYECRDGFPQQKLISEAVGARTRDLRIKSP